MKIYCATWLQEISQQQALEAMNKKERLLSYYFIITQNKSTLERYVNEDQQK